MENPSSASDNESDTAAKAPKPKVKSPAESPRPINNKALAAMLRESASFVEKNEFDPILYQTFQDFRAYYKHHNPSTKKKEPKKKPKKKVTTTVIPPPKSPAGASTTSTARAATAATEQPAQPKRVPSPTQPSPSPPVVTSKDEISVDNNSTTSVPTAAASTKDSKDPPGAKPKAAPTAPVVSAEPSPPIVSKAPAGTMFGIKVPKLHVPHLQAAFANTSKKNANRVKDDLAEAAALAAQADHSQRRSKEAAMLANNESVWCEEHFTMGCACKLPGHQLPVAGDERTPTTQGSNVTQPISNRSHSNSQEWNAPAAGAASTTSTSSNVSGVLNHDQPVPASSQVNTTTSSHRPNMQNKPAFQRPVNPSSALIANGWIEQQRRSKMRVVWKDILASLVEGRKPGEETTLWIQREIINAASGKKELEALHQIPMKWLQDVAYLDYTADHRFTIKVFNLQEDFLFKCADDEAARNWVITLRSARDAAQAGGKNPTHGKQPTSAMDEWDLIPKETSSFEEEEKKRNEPSPPPAHQQEQAPKRQESSKASIRELRATCHGAGVNTAGMERGELERAANEVLKRGTYFDAPSGRVPRPPPTAPPPTDDSKARQEEQRRQDELRARQDALRKQQEMKIAEQHIAQAEVAAKEEERRRNLEEETRRRVEQGRIKQAADEEHRRRLVEQERLRQIAEQQAAEQRHRQEEEHRRQQQAAWQQQQAAWQKQQQEEDRRRNAAEQQAAEARKRQEEAYRRQQQFSQQQPPQHTQQHPQGWHQQQQQQQQQHAQQQHWQQQQQQAHPPQQHWQHQQHSQQPRHNTPPHPQQQQPQQQPQQHRNSAASQKYAQMANQDSDNGQAAVTRIKHEILIKWALQPPLLQSLRPIEGLITTIHTVFPPALGVARHDYFSNWTSIKQSEVLEGGRPDDVKLKKAVRKLRFFLHPDKLPRDLNTEQSFMVKMLWDITSDAWDEFHKQAEELDWIK